MKRKDWVYEWAITKLRVGIVPNVAIAQAKVLRAAEKRGFKRAVKLLREYEKSVPDGVAIGSVEWFCRWLEAQERK